MSTHGMACSKCRRRFSYPEAVWSLDVEKRAIGEGWWFWDWDGPVEKLGVVLCPIHNDIGPTPEPPEGGMT